MRKKLYKMIACALAVSLTLSSNITAFANQEVQTQAENEAYDPNYPLAGLLEQFGLNDTGYTDPMIASANGAWLPYTDKYQYINNGSSNLAAVAAVLAGETYRNGDGVATDPIQYIADANSLTYEQANQMIGMICDFLNSFDWRNADDLTKAQKAGEFITNGANYGKQQLPLGTIGNILLYKSGGCRSFAETYHLITRLLGMDSIVVETYSHQWNYVKINGEWYYYDASAIAAYGSDTYNLTSADLSRDEARYGAIYSPSKEILSSLGIS